MIIQLDSNYRNRALYPNPSSYAIEINGTPPGNTFSRDERGYYITNNDILFSFYFFKETKYFPYTSFPNDTVVINLNEIPELQYLNNLYTNSVQNYFMGYLVKDFYTNNTSIIKNSYKIDNKITLILENIITSNINSKLKIINPSLSLGNNLLINGYSLYNQTPNVGFYRNEGVHSHSVILNLTKGIKTTILSVENPYRNVIFNKKSLKPNREFEVDQGDYLIIINKRYNKEFLNDVYELKDIYPIALREFKIIEINYDQIEVNDIFISDFGENTDPLFPLIDDYYFHLDKNYIVTSPTRKIVLMAKKKFKNIIEWDIIHPGNQIQNNQLYILKNINNPSTQIKLLSISTSYCVENIEPKSNEIFHLMFFINQYTAIPYYSVIKNIHQKLIYLETPAFFNNDELIGDQYIYYKTGSLIYHSMFPNLVLPVSHTVLSCYQVQLSKISLPNLPICGSNLLLADYPYILVTFGNLTNTNLDGRSGTNNIGSIWSNNPYANSATFLCAIANIKAPDIIRYVVVRSSQIVTMKLNLAENLRISVYLPDGSLIRYSKRYEIDYQKNSVSSMGCYFDESLTQNTNNNDSFTKIFSYNDNLSISVTFYLQMI